MNISFICHSDTGQDTEKQSLNFRNISSPNNISFFILLRNKPVGVKVKFKRMYFIVRDPLYVNLRTLCSLANTGQTTLA